MNTHEGYSKKTISNANVLLAGGGDKSLVDFIGGIQYVSASAKILIKTAADNASWLDLVTLVTTDENVKLTPKTDNTNRPLMMINGGTSVGELTSTSMFSTGIYANASTKTITSNGFIKNSYDDTSVLLAGGGAKALNDFAMAHSHPYIPHLGNKSTFGNGSNAILFSKATEFCTTANLPIGAALAYGSNGVEYTALFSKHPSSENYATILRWGYADKYLYIARKEAGNWKSTDWEKISAGYADSAGDASTLDGTAKTDLFSDFSRPSNTNNLSITIGGTTKAITLGSNAFNSTAFIVKSDILDYLVEPNADVDLNSRYALDKFYVTGWSYSHYSYVLNQPGGDRAVTAATVISIPGLYPWLIYRDYSSNNYYVRGYYGGTGWTSWARILLSTDAINATYLGGVQLGGLFTSFTRPTNTNNLSITVGGVTLSVTLGARAFDSDTYLYSTALTAPQDSTYGTGPIDWAKTYSETRGMSFVYNSYGAEYSYLFGIRGNYGSILKMGYTDRYLRILRKSSGTWQSTDWEKIYAGYADSAGSVAWSNITDKPSTYPPSSHTHDYLDSIMSWNNATSSNSVDLNTQTNSWGSRIKHTSWDYSAYSYVTNRYDGTGASAGGVWTFPDRYGGLQIGVPYNSSVMYFRKNYNGTWSSWVNVITSANIGSLTVSKANTWTTARTLTIGNTGKSVDGSTNVSWSLAEIGAQAAGSYVPFSSASVQLTDAWIRGQAINGTYTLVIYNSYSLEWAYWICMNPSKAYGTILRISYDGWIQYCGKLGGAADTSTNWSDWYDVICSRGGQTINGNLTATNFYTTSDRNKKQNISSFSEHIRKFLLKDTEKYAYGVIAQEVEEMFRDGEEGNMTVNYNSILSFYIGQLENKVKMLEERIKRLESK